jgi:carboxypeptidase T
MGKRFRVASVVLLVALAVGLMATPAQTAPWYPQSSGEPLTEPVVVRFYFSDQDQLNQVAGELDIWEAHPDEKYAVALVTPAEYQWLESLGYRVEIDSEKTELLGIEAPLDARFHYYDSYYANPNGLYVVNFLQSMAAVYPDLTELIDAGDAWLGAVGGEYLRNMWVLRITNEDSAYGPIEEKPVFFLLANIHAREVATPELAIRYMAGEPQCRLRPGDAESRWALGQ